MGAKLDSVLVDLSALRQTEHLVAAAVGQDRLWPANKSMEAAAARDQLVARTEHQVIGVAKNDAGANLLKMLRSQGLNRALGADGHEDGRLDVATRCPEDPS